jgi:peptidyl-prolyl cis-trans isomerase SurA
MTLRISQFAVMCGLSMLALPGVTFAQAPRYQSPLSLPGSPQPQLTLPVPASITPNATVVEDVIVHVNDQIINRSDVERSVQQLAQENQQSSASPAEAAEREKNLLRDMIDQQLLLSRAKELNLNVDAEVIRRLDEIRKQNHMDSMEDLEKAARSQGVSFEDFKAQIRNGLLTQQVVRDEVGRRLQMTQTQEQAYYDAHKQEFTQPEQIRLSEILIPTAADANDAAVAQAQAKADDVAAKLKAGGKFEDLAKSYSGGQTAGQGGDLGMYKRGALAKVLEDQTFVLKAGESTAPIRTRQGFVILKVTEHPAAGVPPLKEVEQQVEEAMYSEQMQPALRAYLTKLREDSYIEIAQGFVDSGASPKQTKPIFTAYAPPVVKKKRVEQKQRFDRGGRYSATNKPAAPAVATPVAAVTSTAASTTGKTRVSASKGKVGNAKPKKIKREKIRFGQAPRNSLPAGPQEAGVVGGDTGAGATSAAVTPGGTMAAGAAPGTAIAPLEGPEAASSSALDADPLAPKPAELKKTRFSDRAKTEKVVKAKAQSAKAKEKAPATPVAASAVEKATQKAQAAPLGLNGDTAKKKRKVKVKGAPKERLQNKPPAPAAAPPEEIPSKAPDRGTPLEGTAGAGKAAPTSSDKTTLPPATAPAPGAPADGGATPATPGSPIPTPTPQ